MKGKSLVLKAPSHGLQYFNGSAPSLSIITILFYCVDELSISSFLNCSYRSRRASSTEAAEQSGFQNFPSQQLQKGTLSLLLWGYLSSRLPLATATTSTAAEVPCRTKASHDRTLLMACMLYTSILPLQPRLLPRLLLPLYFFFGHSVLSSCYKK